MVDLKRRVSAIESEIRRRLRSDDRGQPRDPEEVNPDVATDDEDPAPEPDSGGQAASSSMNINPDVGEIVEDVRDSQGDSSGSSGGTVGDVEGPGGLGDDPGVSDPTREQGPGGDQGGTDTPPRDVRPSIGGGVDDIDNDGDRDSGVEESSPDTRGGGGRGVTEAAPRQPVESPRDPEPLAAFPKQGVETRDSRVGEQASDLEQRLLKQAGLEDASFRGLPSSALATVKQSGGELRATLTDAGEEALGRQQLQEQGFDPANFEINTEGDGFEAELNEQGRRARARQQLDEKGLNPENFEIQVEDGQVTAERTDAPGGSAPFREFVRETGELPNTTRDPLKDTPFRTFVAATGEDPTVAERTAAAVGEFGEAAADRTEEELGGVADESGPQRELERIEEAIRDSGIIGAVQTADRVIDRATPDAPTAEERLAGAADAAESLRPQIQNAEDALAGLNLAGTVQEIDATVDRATPDTPSQIERFQAGLEAGQDAIPVLQTQVKRAEEALAPLDLAQRGEEALDMTADVAGDTADVIQDVDATVDRATPDVPTPGERLPAVGTAAVTPSDVVEAVGQARADQGLVESATSGGLLPEGETVRDVSGASFAQGGGGLSAGALLAANPSLERDDISVTRTEEGVRAQLKADPQDIRENIARREGVNTSQVQFRERDGQVTPVVVTENEDAGFFGFSERDLQDASEEFVTRDLARALETDEGGAPDETEAPPEQALEGTAQTLLQIGNVPQLALGAEQLADINDPATQLQVLADPATAAETATAVGRTKAIRAAEFAQSNPGEALGFAGGAAVAGGARLAAGGLAGGLSRRALIEELDPRVSPAGVAARKLFEGGRSTASSIASTARAASRSDFVPGDRGQADLTFGGQRVDIDTQDVVDTTPEPDVQEPPLRETDEPNVGGGGPSEDFDDLLRLSQEQDEFMRDRDVDDGAQRRRDRAQGPEVTGGDTDPVARAREALGVAGMTAAATRLDEAQAQEIRSEADTRLRSRGSVDTDVFSGGRPDVDQTLGIDTDTRIDSDVGTDTAQDLDQDLEQDLGQDLDQDLGQDLDQDLRRDLERDLGRDLDRDLDFSGLGDEELGGTPPEPAFEQDEEVFGSGIPSPEEFLPPQSDEEELFADPEEETDPFGFEDSAAGDDLFGGSDPFQ